MISRNGRDWPLFPHPPTKFNKSHHNLLPVKMSLSLARFWRRLPFSFERQMVSSKVKLCFSYSM